MDRLATVSFLRDTVQSNSQLFVQLLALRTHHFKIHFLAKGSSHGMPDKRELVRLELDRLHVEIVRAKSMVDDFTLISARDSFHTANSIEFSGKVLSALQ